MYQISLEREIQIEISIVKIPVIVSGKQSDIDK